jgi:hypothetical protein
MVLRSCLLVKQLELLLPHLHLLRTALFQVGVFSTGVSLILSPLHHSQRMC